MLKIKDNVDLKELEKYGFEYFENGCGTTGYFYNTINGSLTIIEKDKEYDNEYAVERKIPTNQAIRFNLDILYDLIKDDLVEKVEE